MPNLALFWSVFVICFDTIGSLSSDPFPKDQRMDMDFPPLVKKTSDSGIPTGHLRPLGYQRKPDGKVKEYKEVLHPKQFWEDHVSKARPLVFRQAVIQSVAFQNWNDAYLRENYGDLDVLIEKKVENRGTSPQRMELGKFLDNYHREDWYVVTVLPDDMRKDLQVPKCLLCGTFREYLQECNFWMSSGGTASVLHYDADDNIHCLLDGRKDFIMINPKYGDYLDMVDKNKWSGSGFSTMDIDMINVFKNPDVVKAPWTWATLRPGDCIYIPAEYLHQVRSYGRSVAATYLFATDGEFKDTGCENTTLSYTSLADVEVMWTYKKGDKTIDMGFMNVEILRKGLIFMLKGQDKVYKETYAEHYREMEDKDDEPLPPLDDAWLILDKENNGYLTLNEILTMDREVLKEFARFIDPPHGPAAGEHDEL
ncbi:bifunctional peptidase and (3S)-lysyl hydroxylase Jmjd7-like [Glandiceps talaboti]